MKVTIGQLRKIIKEEVEMARLDAALHEAREEILQEGWTDKIKKVLGGALLAATLATGGAAVQRTMDKTAATQQADKQLSDQFADFLSTQNVANLDKIAEEVGKAFPRGQGTMSAARSKATDPSGKVDKGAFAFGISLALKDAADQGVNTAEVVKNIMK